MTNVLSHGIRRIDKILRTCASFPRCLMAALSACLCVFISIESRADDDPSVLPYRPSVSNPAALPEPGWLEFEIGLFRESQGSHSRDTTVPFMLEYAFTPDLGIILAGDAQMVHTDPTSGRQRGQGDTTLLLKHHWSLDDGDDAPALGLEWGFTAPTAKRGMGCGKSDYVITGIFSGQLRDNTLDINIGARRLGEIEAGADRVQWGWAVTLSRSLNAAWSIAGELSGISRSGAPPKGQALFALGYTVSKRLVIDAGFAIGTNAAAPNHSVFVGLAYLFGPLHGH